MLFSPPNKSLTLFQLPKAISWGMVDLFTAPTTSANVYVNVVALNAMWYLKVLLDPSFAPGNIEWCQR